MTETSSSVDGQNPNTPDRAELLGLYKTAIEEYRFEVNLGWDRQKFFVGLNVSLLAALAGFAKLGGEQASTTSTRATSRASTSSKAKGRSC